MYRGNRIRYVLYPVKNNPVWIIFCKAESGITGTTRIIGISTGLHCS